MSDDPPTSGPPPAPPAQTTPPDDATTARRPIRARASRWVAAVVDGLDRLGCTPNAVSIASVVAAAIGAASLVVASQTDGLVAVLLLATAPVWIVLRLLCNLFDGMLAVEKGRGRPTGIVFNEVPDRVSDVLLLAAAGFVATPSALGVHLGWGAAALAVIVAYVRAFGASCGAGQDFRGPMAKAQRMVVLAVACVGTAVERLATDHAVTMTVALALIVVGGAVTVARRLSGLFAHLDASA